jgi:hypothetical protein
MMSRQFLYLSAALFFVTLVSSCKKQNTDKERPVTFKAIQLKESHRLGGSQTNPLLNIELNLQYPTAFSDDRILNKIRRSILQDFLQDQADTTDNPETALQACVRKKINLYESSKDYLPDEDEADSDEGVSKREDSWWDKTSLLIRYNDHGLLSYTVHSDQYTGGAHGGNSFRNSVIDLKNGEKVREEDLFTEESLPLINQIILKKLEMKNKVQSPEELEQIGYFDVSEVGQYKNFYLTEKGITYTFNAYEIGSYDLGTIEVELTFKDIAGFQILGSPLERLTR